MSESGVLTTTDLYAIDSIIEVQPNSCICLLLVRLVDLAYNHLKFVYIVSVMIKYCRNIHLMSIAHSLLI